MNRAATSSALLFVAALSCATLAFRPNPTPAEPKPEPTNELPKPEHAGECQPVTDYRPEPAVAPVAPDEESVVKDADVAPVPDFGPMDWIPAVDRHEWHETYEKGLDAATESNKPLAVLLMVPNGPKSAAWVDRISNASPANYEWFKCNAQAKINSMEARNWFKLPKTATYPIIVVQSGQEVEHHIPKELFPWLAKD